MAKRQVDKALITALITDHTESLTPKQLSKYNYFQLNRGRNEALLGALRIISAEQEGKQVDQLTKDKVRPILQAFSDCDKEALVKLIPGILASKFASKDKEDVLEKGGQTQLASATTGDSVKGKLSGETSLKVTFESFKCHEQSDGMTGSSEVYFYVNAGDENYKNSHQTGEYGDVDEGETHTVNVVVYNHSLGESFFLNVECWEKDESSSEFRKELGSGMAEVAGACLSAASAFYFFGQPIVSGIFGVASIVFGVVASLLMFFTNDDDLAGETTVGYTKDEVLSKRSFGVEIPKTSTGHYTVYFRFECS